MATDLSYELGPQGRLLLMDEAVAHFRQHAQRHCWQMEAGGQLFASIDKGVWRVKRATGPRRSDLRSRFGFRPDRKVERAEIEMLFTNGLHYVGDWHTHPQDDPYPSDSDISSMTDIVRKSEHDLQGFILIIVGRGPPPEGLWVSLHLRNGTHRQLALDVSQ